MSVPFAKASDPTSQQETGITDALNINFGIAKVLTSVFFLKGKALSISIH